MQADVDNDSWSETLWASAITPLLEEYLHNRSDREEQLRRLQPDRLTPAASTVLEGVAASP